MKLSALILTAFLFGCATEAVIVPETPQETTLQKAAREVHLAIFEARAALSGLNQTIAQNATEGVWTKEHAQDMLDKSKAARKELDAAQNALSMGNVLDAENQRALVMKAIIALQREAAAKGRGE